MSFQRILLFALVAAWCVCATAQSSSPVVVELFTSEGCSSCPPADEFLRALDAKQPIEGTQLIVLGEHVDYWDDQGWRDIYSDHSFTVRQDNYVNRMGLKSSYTPQMIVDGAVECSGNDRQRAIQALEKARAGTKVALKISSVTIENGKLHAHIETGVAAGKADLILALALDHAESQVLRGENSGHRLEHVAITRDIVKVGRVAKGATFVKDVEIKTKVTDASYRVIALLQQPDQGKILGAAVERVGAEKSVQPAQQ
jgi:hypothetical protein